MKKSTANSYQETCVICEEKKEDGIHLYTVFLCQRCEEKLIHTETNEPVYLEYIQKLKKMTLPQVLS